ncbi:phenylacetate--CoA ligase family protein [Aquimarina sp. MMG015]|uniref:phenylacetate--CoA ligase family protein n=1 Tax=Aquimarina TaxID=290174 RepID=UPI00041E5C39|nr:MULTISPECIES: phenylacetate--CoA ligase family protein [Aquimarina]MBQ4802010.1 phenylacetate--CoA ligase family protein [Aquimarina sp. MMG015]
MRVNEKIRNISFWIVDFVSGGKIRRHYLDIKDSIENPSKKPIIDKQSKFLQDVLNHAVTSTVFYKDIIPENLENFPVVNKEIVRSSYQKIQSQKHKNSKKIGVSTSGSTGASFTVYQDINKKARNTADIIYFSELCGFNIGYKLFYLRFWNMFKKKNKLASFFQNITPIDVFDLSSDSIKDLVNVLKNDKSNKGMLGYASSFDKICKYLDTINSTPIHCKLRSVIGMSERLDPLTKKSMKKYFDVDMVSRYSNAENGMIAQQPSQKEYFIINWASYYVEILDFNNDTRVTPGTLGRIVITDLFNYDTPMIRYDTGDIGIMNYIEDQKVTRSVLTKVEGRKMDMIRSTSGEILSTSILLVINKYKEVKQRQIIQKTADQYLIKLKTENNVFEKENEFIKEFKEYLGEDALIKLEYVSEIPLLNSGKQRAIVNEFSA